MAGDQVLLTGATGLVGFRILEELLNNGYDVRVAVRSTGRVEDIKSALQRAGLKDVIFDAVVIPDMLRDGVFDEAQFRGC